MQINYVIEGMAKSQRNPLIEYVIRASELLDRNSNSQCGGLDL